MLFVQIASVRGRSTFTTSAIYSISSNVFHFLILHFGSKRKKNQNFHIKI